MTSTLLLLFAVSVVCSCFTFGLFLIKARKYDLRYRYVLECVVSSVVAMVIVNLLLG